MKISAAIIGLGQMGSQYDTESGDTPRSHLGVLLKDPRFQVSALVDLNPEAIRLAQKRWVQIADLPSHSTLKYLKSESAAVIVISTSSQNRLEVVEMALEKKPKLLVIEKPLALTFAEASALLEKARKKNVPIRVNFQRRFDPQYLKVREEIGNEIPVKIVLRYGKGLFNYASHHIDFLQDWFGKIESAESIGERNCQNPSFVCKMQSGFEAVVLGFDDLGYDQFEAQLFFRNRYFEFLNGGCEKSVRTSQEGIYYPGYTQMAAPKRVGTDGPVSGLSGFYASIADWFEKGGVLPGCDGENALDGLKILESIERETKK